MPQHLKIKLCRHPYTPTGRLGRGPVFTFHSRILPYLGASGCGFLVACLGRRCPRSSLRVLGISSQPLLSPSPRDSLVPGAPRRLLPLAWRALHHQPRGHAPVFLCGAALPGLCSLSTPTRSLSPSVSPQRRPPDCSRRCRRCCSSRSRGGSESASERGREAAGLPSALLIPSSQVALLFPSSPSPPLRSAPLPHALPPPLQARPREPRVPGPCYPGNRLGDHSRQLPAPSHAHLLGVSPSQVPGPSRQRSPGFLAEAGGWVKRRGISEERQVQGERQYWVDAPLRAQRGREMRQNRGRLQGGVSREGSLQSLCRRNWYWKAQGSLERKARPGRELPGGRAEAAGVSGTVGRAGAGSQ